MKFAVTASSLDSALLAKPISVHMKPNPKLHSKVHCNLKVILVGKEGTKNISFFKCPSIFSSFRAFFSYHKRALFFFLLDPNLDDFWVFSAHAKVKSFSFENEMMCGDSK